MKVSVEIFMGKRFDIEVQPTDTVLNVKKQIEEIQGAQIHPSEQQLLIYQDKVLKDKTTIKENKVSENAFLVVKLSKKLKYRKRTYHVQNPCTKEFSASHLDWSKVKGRLGIVDDVAVIPYYRVEDFVKGEGSSAETRFCRAARKIKKKDSLDKQRVDATLETALYWCHYGRHDHRRGKKSCPSKKCSKSSKKKCEGRPSIKRGCLSHFSVKRLTACPFVAFITYKERDHVDGSRSACHKPLDDKAIGKRFMTRPSNHGGTDPPLTPGPSNHRGIDLPPAWCVKKSRSKLGTVK